MSHKLAQHLKTTSTGQFVTVQTVASPRLGESPVATPAKPSPRATEPSPREAPAHHAKISIDHVLCTACGKAVNESRYPKFTLTSFMI